MRSALAVTMPPRYSRGFTWKVNRSSALGRDLSATMNGLAEHLGGASEVSLTELFLSERVAYIERRLREHESAILNGEAGVMTEGEYGALVGQLSGLCTKLGLRRRARPTLSLADYLRKAEATEMAVTPAGSHDEPSAEVPDDAVPEPSCEATEGPP